MKKEFIITDETGLHARPASLIVNEMNKFASDGTIKVDAKEANIKSIMGIMGLMISKDQVIEVEITGADEEDAMDAVQAVIIDNNLGKVNN